MAVKPLKMTAAVSHEVMALHKMADKLQLYSRRAARIIQSQPLHSRALLQRQCSDLDPQQ